MSRLLKIIGLFRRISSLLKDSFAKETYNFKAPTNRSHPIVTEYLMCICDISDREIDRQTGRQTHRYDIMGWLRSVGSLK